MAFRSEIRNSKFDPQITRITQSAKRGPERRLSHMVNGRSLVRLAKSAR